MRTNDGVLVLPHADYSTLKGGNHTHKGENSMATIKRRQQNGVIEVEIECGEACPVCRRVPGKSGEHPNWCPVCKGPDKIHNVRYLWTCEVSEYQKPYWISGCRVTGERKSTRTTLAPSRHKPRWPSHN